MWLGRSARPAATRGLSFVVPECNSLGLGLMCTQGIDEALTAMENGEADTLIILENDLFRRGRTDRINACLEKCAHVVLIDHVLHDTASKADIILPAATFAEQSGTLVNNEGRGQRFFQVFVPEGEIHPSLAMDRRLYGRLWALPKHHCGRTSTMSWPGLPRICPYSNLSPILRLQRSSAWSAKRSPGSPIARAAAHR